MAWLRLQGCVLFGALISVSLVSIAGSQGPDTCGDDKCRGERFRVTKSLDILLPRDRELVQWSEDGIAISLQLLGANLAGEGRAVQLSVDRGALDFEIKELAGRIALPPGPHSIRAELLGVTGCEECVSEVNFTVEDRYTQAPGSEWVGRAAPHSGCAYVVETQVHKAEGAGTEGEVFIALRGERAAGWEVLLPATGGAFADGERSCFVVPARCEGSDESHGELTHLFVRHRTEDSWRGLYLTNITAWGPVSCPTCAAAASSTAERVACDEKPLGEPSVGELSGSKRKPEPLHFWCARWFDDQAGFSGVCPHSRCSNGSNRFDCAASSHRGVDRAYFDDALPFVTNTGLGINGMMGNQLFQLAALLAAAARAPVKTQVVLPDVPWNGREQERLRLFELFDLAIPLIPVPFLRARVQTSLIERHYHFDPSLAALAGSGLSVDLIGRFQSARYFEHEPAVRAAMRVRPRLQRIAEAAVAQVRRDWDLGSGGRVVSLHLRRGDNVPANRDKIYAGWRAEAPELYGAAGDSVAPHLLVGQGYIHRAAEVIEADGFCTVAGARGCAYLLFTDTPSDVAWARSNLPRGLNVSFFADLVPLVATWEEGAGAMGSPQRRVAALTDVVDLAAIAACDAHIVSPSTYSWWGAWLNSAPHKRVVIPRPWFNPDHPMGQQSQTHTMHPPDWIEIDLEMS